MKRPVLVLETAHQNIFLMQRIFSILCDAFPAVRAAALHIQRPQIMERVVRGIRVTEWTSLDRSVSLSA